MNSLERKVSKRAEIERVWTGPPGHVTSETYSCNPDLGSISILLDKNKLLESRTGMMRQ